LEVRRCGDGHPSVTERERVIRLNGIGGVTFQNVDRIIDPRLQQTIWAAQAVSPPRLGSLPRGEACNFRQAVMSKVLVVTEQFAERAN
jgi:hypothetical protein